MPLLNMLGVRVAIGTPITVRVALGGLLGIAGIVLVFSPELRSLGADAKVVRGALFTALAVVTAAAGSVVAARNAHQGVPVWQGMAFAMFYGAVFSLLFAIASSRPLEFDWSLRYLGSLLCVRLDHRVRRLSHAAGPHRRGTRGLHRGDGADRRVGDLCRFRRLRVARADLARDRAVDRGKCRDPAPSMRPASALHGNLDEVVLRYVCSLTRSHRL